MQPFPAARTAVCLAACLAGGAAEAYSLSGVAWDDLDGDGVREPGEVLIANKLMKLHRHVDGALLAEVSTDAGGAYHFDDIAAGTTVRVCTRFDAGFSPTHAAADEIDNDFGDDPANPGCTSAFWMTRSFENVDAGLDAQDVSVGNFVWHDRNRNGRQDAGEAGIGDVLLELRSADGGIVYDRARSGDNGRYYLYAPVAATYQIRILLPEGATLSPNAVGDPLLDSDFTLAAPGVGAHDIVIASNVVSTSIVDAGLMFANPVDAALGFTGVPALAIPGSDIAWSLRLHNSVEPFDIDSARLRVPVPAGLADVEWECSAAGGATCGVSAGIGAIDRVFSLPDGGELNFGFVAHVLPSTGTHLMLTATADVGGPQRDVRPGNNEARARANLNPDAVFDDQFEAR